MEVLIGVAGYLASSEYVQSFLSPELVAEVGYTMMVLGIAWLKFGKKVATFTKDAKNEIAATLKTADEHFKAMEHIVDKKLTEVVEELQSFKAVVQQDLQKGEARMNELDNRLKKVEQTKGG